MDYETLFDKYKTCVKDLASYTSPPSDLDKIIEKLELNFAKYNNSSSAESQQYYLEIIDSYLTRYAEIKYILDNVLANTSTVVPDYETLLQPFRDEDSEEDTNIPLMGEELLSLIHRESGLKQKSNYLHQLYVELYGHWLDSWNSVDQIRKFMLRFAENEWLDEWAYQYGLLRNEDETDDELRNRIIRKITELFTTLLVKQNNVTFFTCVNDPQIQLTSHNTYLTNDYLCYAPEQTEEYYNSTYITWRDIIWL